MAKSLMIVDDSATMRKIVIRTVRMSGLNISRVEEAEAEMAKIKVSA